MLDRLMGRVMHVTASLPVRPCSLHELLGI